MLRSHGQWTVWADQFAAITSVLAGPHVDPGLGVDAAKHKAQDHGVTLAPLKD